MTTLLPSLADLREARVRVNPRQPPRKKHYLLVLWQGEEIVFVGTTTTPENRMVELERGSAKEFDGYTLREVWAQDVDSLLLDLILTHKPRYNDRLPRNWKLVSKGALKVNRGISGHAVNKAVRQGQLKPIYYNGITYFLKSEVAEVFG